MSLNINELRKTLTVFINRPSKLGYGDPNFDELNQFMNSLTSLCEEHVDPKFEYDGDTKCSICTEYYLEDEIAEQQRVKLQNCFHQAHKHCIADKLKKNATCCDIASCYNTHNWDKIWKDAILNDIQQRDVRQQIQPPPQTRANQQQQIPQHIPQHIPQQIPKQNNETCPICNKAFTSFDNTTTNTSCSHVYCNPCFSKMISDYKVGALYKETDVICKGCKLPLAPRVISEIDQQYWNKIEQQRTEDFLKQFT